ncbi:MAG TPA: alpha/beta fold hydrolase [Polyangiaceae bacterium]
MQSNEGFVRAARGQLAALFDEQRRAWRRAASVPRVLEQARRTRVGISPSEIVFRRGSATLFRYRRETPARHKEPVFFCYALINRPYILDLQPGKSVVQRYLEEGFDVYLLDWGTPSPEDSALTLEDYVCRILNDAVDFVLAMHRLEALHMLGYCMGGTLAALFVAEHPTKVRTLTLLAAPIDFSDRNALLNLWTDRRHFDVDAFVAAFGNCPGWFLQGCFLSLRPVQNLMEKQVAFMERLDDPEFVENYFAMERWLNDNIPMAGETFRQFVKKLYQENQLVRGEFRLGDRRVDLGRIVCPVLLLTADNDHLVAPKSTEGIRAHLGSLDVQALTTRAGHVGLVVGGKAQTVLWPTATRWLAERSTAHTPVPAERGVGAIDGA